ncbi:hypothetical protein [uncultured Marinobacter sp.]|jgi:hypothetical protein|uniref:hypothetical protein n=1 Tax=uncultured Marinobacter sp. TaxID=187379 RepID=UPI0030D93E70|tara:strand:- start:40 stop:393 length:354 start_codon:yes stop_codon:yes gene_type:complete
MGQYHRLVNITKKEYVDPWGIGGMGKHVEQLWNHKSLQDALYCLVIAQGNDARGGGDVTGSDMLGRWTGDRCAIVGDYYTDILDDKRFRNLFEGCATRKGWIDISPDVLQMFKDIDL